MIKKKLSRWLAIALAAACLPSMAVYGSEAEEEKEAATISLMIFQSWNSDAFEEILAEIKEEENITVDLQVVPDSEFTQLVQTKAAVGELPDLITQNSNQIAVLGAENFADLSNEEWVSRLSKPETVTYDGKIMAFPMKAYSYAGGVFYNKTVFESLGIEVPTTYDEFLAVCEKIKTEGNGVVPIGRSDSESWTTNGFLAQGIPYSLYPDHEDVFEKIATNELSWTEIPEIQTVVESFLEIYEKGYVNEDYYTTSWATAQENLANGTYAMMVCADFCVSTIASTYPDKLDDIGFFPFPMADQQLVATGPEVWSMFASANSKNLDAVKRFLNAYSQKEYQDKFYAENPCAIPAFTDCDGGDVPQLQVEIGEKYLLTGNYTYEYGCYMPSEASSAYDAFLKNMMAGVSGEMTATEIIEEYDKALEEAMTANNMEGWE